MLEDIALTIHPHPSLRRNHNGCIIQLNATFSEKRDSSCYLNSDYINYYAKTKNRDKTTLEEVFFLHKLKGMNRIGEISMNRKYQYPLDLTGPSKETVSSMKHVGSPSKKGIEQRNQ